jgi:hypothetical protein
MWCANVSLLQYTAKLTLVLPGIGLLCPLCRLSIVARGHWGRCHVLFQGVGNSNSVHNRIWHCVFHLRMYSSLLESIVTLYRYEYQHCIGMSTVCKLQLSVKFKLQFTIQKVFPGRCTTLLRPHCTLFVNQLSLNGQVIKTPWIAIDNNILFYSLVPLHNVLCVIEHWSIMSMSINTNK